jgi:thioredoxin 1
MKWMTRTLFFVLFLSCQKAEDRTLTVAAGRQERSKVTFIELGSVNCIPCKMMQPV